MSERAYAAQRELDVFAGGVAADTAFLDSVVEWLTESCGLRAGHAPTALVSARNYLFAVSPAALQAESFVMLMQSASREVGEYAGLRLVALVREGVSDRELPPFLADHAVVHAGSAGLTPDIARQILEALYPDPPGVHGAPETVQDVYFTRSWIDDPMESEPADRVCSRASGLGFRLIGDTEDPEFDPVVRLPKIMAGCGASIAVLPYRDGPERTSPWMLEELRLAREAGLPCVIAKDPRVALSRDVADAPNVVALVDTSTSEDWTTRLDSALQSLAGHWRTPANPADVLYLTDGNRPVETARTLVRRMTAMALTTLDRPLPDRETLLEVVREADLVLCDLPRADCEGWIAAGCAVAFGRTLEILTTAPPLTGIRGALHVRRYGSELEWLGQLHRVLRRHRRKVMNVAAAAPAGG